VTSSQTNRYALSANLAAVMQRAIAAFMAQPEPLRDQLSTYARGGDHESTETGESK